MTRESHELARIASLAIVLVWVASLPVYAAGTTPVYDVEISVDLDAGRYSGREVVRYTNRTKGAVDAVFFNLYPNV